MSTTKSDIDALWYLTSVGYAIADKLGEAGPRDEQRALVSVLSDVLRRIESGDERAMTRLEELALKKLAFVLGEVAKMLDASSARELRNLLRVLVGVIRRLEPKATTEAAP